MLPPWWGRPAGSGGACRWAAIAWAAGLSGLAVRSGRRTVVAGDLAGLRECARTIQAGGLRSEAGDLAGVALQSFEHGQDGQGMAAAMAWATRSGWAWATLPPIEARVPAMTSSQP